jgi:hypothetical protein
MKQNLYFIDEDIENQQRVTREELDIEYEDSSKMKNMFLN